MSAATVLHSVAKPFVKSAGGKTQLLPVLMPILLSQPFNAYHEPFVGGGAVFFALRATFRGKAFLADSNSDLMDAYRAVRDYPLLLIGMLQEHREKSSEEYFKKVRRWQDHPEVHYDTDLGRAARMVYLSKTAFNGLWRTNQKGEFNTPWGKYENPNICDAPRIHACHHALKGTDVRCEDFRQSALRVREGDLVYMDPPYVPTSKTSNFVGYGRDGFDERDQRDLAETFRELAARGARVALSNADCELVRELYNGFNIHEVSARRSINSKGGNRGPVGEVVVTNF